MLQQSEITATAVTILYREIRCITAFDIFENRSCVTFATAESGFNETSSNIGPDTAL